MIHINSSSCPAQDKQGVLPAGFVLCPPSPLPPPLTNSNHHTNLTVSDAGAMKDRTERFMVLPFNISCASLSSVAVSTCQPEKQKPESLDVAAIAKGRQNGEAGPSKERAKGSHGYPTLSKPNTNFGFWHKLRRSIKCVSQLFVYREEEEEEIEEIEAEMEIGYPTDVKHVTHIGLDGSRHTNPVKEWENINAPEILAFPSISLKQFDFAMAAHTNHHLSIDPAKF